MDKITVKSYAKINFFLKITGLNEKGYHTLDMVNASIGLYDTVAVKMREDGEINVACPGIEKEKNTAYKAALLFKERYNTRGFDILVNKGIPLAAGLGGSSADSAAALFALKALFNADTQGIRDIALMCGSDTLYMLSGGYAGVRGTGEIISPFECGKAYSIVIAKPEKGVSAADSYKMYDKLNNNAFSGQYCDSAVSVIAALRSGNFAGLKKHCANSLYLPSCRIVPEIENTLMLLNNYGAEVSLMSGSGSACFGVFNDAKAAKTACENITRAGYYAIYTSTVKNGIEII